MNKGDRYDGPFLMTVGGNHLSVEQSKELLLGNWIPPKQYPCRELVVMMIRSWNEGLSMLLEESNVSLNLQHVLWEHRRFGLKDAKGSL
jgi:hypothetical protein